jgi:hypothetical protein
VRVNRGMFGWGVFFLVVGLVPLAVQAGVISEATIRGAWRLWPLILIGIGLGIVLERTAAAIVGSLLVSITFGLMVGSVLAAGFAPVAGIGSCGFGGSTGGGEPFQTRTGTLGTTASVSLELTCGEATVATANGSGWQVSGTSDAGTSPAINAAGDRLSIRSPNRQGFNLGAGESWTITLPTDPTTSLSATVNAGSAELRMTDAHVTGVDLSVNAGEMHLDLSSAADTRSVNASVNAGSLDIALPAPEGVLTGNLSANAGSISVCVPDGVALQIRASSSLGGDNFGSRGLSRNGDVWSNQVAGSSSGRIELTTSANLGSINLNPESGCD